MWEIVLILVVALILLGPQQLTETARVLGKLYREIQKMAFDVRNSIDFDSEPSEPRPQTYKPEKETERKVIGDEALLPPPGEKTGPDFYAELLESSKEEEKKSETGESSSESHEKTESHPEKAEGPSTASKS
jgi:Sec-independent protein translocase protein TatA